MKLYNLTVKIFKNLLILISITITILLALYLLRPTTSCFSNEKNAILDNYNPSCTISGNYLPYQKWKMANFTWCVTSDGVIIPDTYKKMSNNSIKDDDYVNNIRYVECINIRNNLNIKQKMVVIIGKIFNPYIS